MTYIEDDEGLDDVSMGLQMQQFLDEWHYRILHSGMAATWDRSGSLTAALELLEAHGMQLSPEEMAYFSSEALPEEQLVEALVAKMPREFRATFEHFTLQLQLIVSTATRVRQALEEGNPAEVTRIVEEGDTGVLQQVLKMTCVEAAAEIGGLKEIHETWKKSMGKRLDRLSKTAAATDEAKSDLDHVMDELACFGAAQNEKSKKVLMGMAGNGEKMLVKTIFNTWQAYFYKYLSEKDIHDKFKAEIEAAQVKLMAFKQAQLDHTRKVLMGSADAGTKGLLTNVFKGWVKDVADEKENRVIAAALEEAEAKLNGMLSTQKENAKKTMARLSAGSDSSLKLMTFQAWQKDIEDTKKENEQNKAMNEAEAKLKEMMKKKSEEARQVVARMVGGQGTALCKQVFSDWFKIYIEEKREREAAEELEKHTAKFKSLNEKQKGGAMNVAEHNIQMENELLLMNAFMNWSTECHVERVHRFYSGKMENKKNQLEAVQGMFKNFATQLEGMASTPRSQRAKRSQRSGSQAN